MTLFPKWPLLCAVALLPAVLPRHPNRGRGLKGAQLPPGCPASSQAREAGSCPKQSWDGTGSSIQVLKTPRSPALSWTCVDLVAALQSSDLVSFMASPCMLTICWYVESCLTLSPSFLLLTSCMSHTPAFSVWAEGKTSLLSSLILSFPLLRGEKSSWHFSLNASFLPLGSRAVHGFWNWLKWFVLPWQGDAKTKHVRLLVLNQDFSYSFPSSLFSKQG